MTIMKHKLLQIIILCTFTISFLGCQEKNSDDILVAGTIYGAITDFATGEPIHNANVQLRPTGETTLTGMDGMYEFQNISDGNYSIIVSKAEYTDLIDDYVIKVTNGRRMRRDVQIEKIPTYIRFTDMWGNDITELNFGADASTNMLSFNIYNNGTVSISCNVQYSCEWIKSVSEVPNSLRPGQNVMVSVYIDRSKLAIGDNSTNLYISSNNGSNVILIKATSSSGNPPIVNMSPIGDITPTTALCTGNIQDTNGGTITNCGFCYSTSPNCSLDDNVINLGSRTGSISYTLTNLKNGCVYYVRFFATTNLGTGYSSEISFTTPTGLPICGTTIVTHLDPSSIRAESTVSTTEDGYYGYITKRGFCWNTSSCPTIYDMKIEHLFDGDGKIRETITSLTPNTIYFIRSFATNEYGTSYGPEVTFQTKAGLATVSTKKPVLSGDQIITGGEIITHDQLTILAGGVCYGFTPNPDLSYSYENTLDYSELYDKATGKFTSYIPKPTCSGYLYIRAYATTDYGTSYGNEVSIYIY